MRLGAVVLLYLFVVGCGDDSAVVAPSAPPTVPTTGDCAGIPIIPPGNPPDTVELTRDLALEGKYPATIDGHPLNDVASGGFIESLCVINGQASVDAAKLNMPAGTDLSTMTVASAQAVVDGLGVQVTTFRWPGHTGTELVPITGILSASVTGRAPRFTSDLEPETVGAKDITRWTNATDGSVSYLYPVGDTLFIVDNPTLSQASKIFSALP